MMNEELKKMMEELKANGKNPHGDMREILLEMQMKELEGQK